MKIRDLLNELKRCQKIYKKDFLDWEVYTEQITPVDKTCKTKGLQKDWPKIKDGDGWQYFSCAGFHTIFTKDRIFTININY